MKITSQKTTILATLLVGLACSTPFFALAQTPSSAPPPLPPGLEKIEEVPDSGITIRQPEKKNKIVDKTKKGQSNEVEVTSGKSTYIVKGDPAVGNAAKGSPSGDANHAAMWKVLEFGGPKEMKEAQPTAELPPAPPPTINATSASIPASGK